MAFEKRVSTVLTPPRIASIVCLFMMAKCFFMSEVYSMQYRVYMLNLIDMSSVLDFISEVKVELSKVVWPSPNQTIRLTVIVIIVTVIVGFFVGGLDYLLTKSLEVLLK